MIKQIKRLTKVSLCNSFGINEFRFTKDKKKKSRFYLFAGLWCFLIVLFMMYIISMCYGLCYLKMGSLVPAVLAMCVSFVVFFFTIFKAGPVLFERRAYERQITLPVTVRAVIISRFLTMYITNMLLGMLVMLPGMLIYAIFEQPGVMFYLYGLLGTLLLPLLPLTAASIIGALIVGISSRWKKKNLIAIVLSLLFVCVIFLGSISMSRMDEIQLEKLLINMAEVLQTQLQNTYPPAIWLTEAMVYGRVQKFILFFLISIGIFIVFLEILQHYYEKICSLLTAQEADRNYKMKGLFVKSVQRSLIERELHHYFSSMVYVTNTMVGYVIMVIMAVAILVMGKSEIETMVGISGIVERVMPIMLGAMPLMMPMSASAISMEGKEWWLMQTLPIRKKDIINSKIWANIIVVLPFYLLAEIFLVIALKPSIIQLFWLIVVPAVYVLFGVKMGIAINLKFPIFDWENETHVVKQSASVFIMMLIGGILGMAPMGVLLYFQGVPAIYIYLGVMVVFWLIMSLMKLGNKRSKVL